LFTFLLEGRVVFLEDLASDVLSLLGVIELLCHRLDLVLEVREDGLGVLETFSDDTLHHILHVLRVGFMR
jgi:hypothetical protein